MVQAPDDSHYSMVADRSLRGGVVFFLGAGVNLCGRPAAASFQPGRYLPSGPELAAHLAAYSHYTRSDSTDLLRVSQYVDLSLGSGPLYEELHKVFDQDYPPTAVHRLLSKLPEMIRSQPLDGRRQFPLIVTTNYDDCLESAFREAGEPFDLVTYIAEGEYKGKFRHTSAEGASEVILVPNSYTKIRFDQRPVIAKIHGAVARNQDDGDSFVVTENHYIAYLSTKEGDPIPSHLAARMKKANVLFLGYSLRDWNLRVILHRMWDGKELSYINWSIQTDPERIEEKAWSRRNVELLDARLEDYIERLELTLSETVQLRGAS